MDVKLSGRPGCRKSPWNLLARRLRRRVGSTVGVLGVVRRRRRGEWRERRRRPSQSRRRRPSREDFRAFRRRPDSRRDSILAHRLSRRRSGTGFRLDGSGPSGASARGDSGAATFESESDISDLFLEELSEVFGWVDGSAERVPGTDAATSTEHIDVRSVACLASVSNQDSPTETEIRAVVEVGVGDTACATSADVAVSTDRPRFKSTASQI